MLSGLQSYINQGQIYEMDFLANFFSCSRPSQNNPHNNCFFPICLPASNKKTTAAQKEKAKDDSVSQKTMSNLSRPASTMACQPSFQMPTTRFLVGSGCFCKSEKEVEWGSFVGVANCQPHHEKLMPASATRLRFGRNEELRSLVSLRRNCLDKLLVRWGELGLDFSLGEALRCRQPLVILVEQKGLLVRLLQAVEQQLLKSLGEFCLLQSSGRIFFNIITFQNYFFLDFQPSSLFNYHAKQLIQKTLSINISQEDFRALLEKMTLNDYILAKKDPTNVIRKLQHYLAEIQREKGQKAALARIQKEKEQNALEDSRKEEEPLPRHLSEALSEEDILRLRKESKSSDFDLQAEYLLQQRQQNAPAAPAPEQDQNLLIYYFNNQQPPEEDFQIVLPTKPINLVRKMRSKSEDATYLTEGEMELDEEFFQKYQ